MLKTQHNKCAICRISFREIKFHIDHDHVSGKVRKLLCGDCNRGIGNFKENSVFMKRASNYIKSLNKKRIYA